MNGNRIFLDTNIVLYLLNGDMTLANFLNGKNLWVSMITEIELLSFKGLNIKEEKVIKQFLSECHIYGISN
jgi:predicted nucleic acid-binding protein